MEPEDEDNVFWRRLPPGNGRTRAIEAFVVEALRAGDVTILGTDVVHSVVNPIPRLSCTLQVYGGTFARSNAASGMQRLSGNSLMTWHRRASDSVISASVRPFRFGGGL